MNKTKHEDVVDQLDQFYIQAKRQILSNQSAITGLFPSSSAEHSSASIKTSLWAASSVFALYLAYSKRVDNDKGKAHDLGQSVVKCMRGILFAWMRQSEKVESFKANQSPEHALHLKFDLHSGLANDLEYPHLQIDVVSLYLIFLSNFIASGLDIIYCMDEVTFIQNLVYYVERAYRTPDYGNWEPALPKHQQQSQQQQQQQQYSTPTTPAAALKSNATCGSSSSNSSMSSYQSASSAPPAHSDNLNTEPINYRHSPSNYSFLSSANIGSATVGGQQQQKQQHQQQVNYYYSSTGYGSGFNGISGDNCGHDGRSLEIHATSIGMAKSALEAINGCNLFGGKGANWSIIYSDIDAHSRNRSIFETLLPRESRSKNTDSYLLATISWPCFATHDSVLYHSTKSKILRKLKGKYGLKRFLRDSYGTVLAPELASGDENSRVQTPANQMGEAGTSTTNTTSAHQSSLARSASNQQAESSSLRESSFSSTSSGSSSITLGEPPKTKQRKSSYFQRKNILRAGQAQDSAGSQQLLQRMDSTTKMSKRFEHIESEWPLFICFLIIDGIFKQDLEQVCENEKLLYERLLKIEPKHGDYLMPKYYYVPQELISNEKCNPDTNERLPSAEGSSADQLYLTGQSILLITRLLLAGLVHPNELDPLRRHRPSHDRPKRIGRYSSFQATSSDLVVQTVLIAESIRLQAMMANYGIQTQTPLEVEPVQIWSSAQLVKVYEYLGVNEKLGLKGRPSRPIGALGTSKLYRICGQTILCYPLIFEVSDFYLAQDMLLLIDDIQNELNFIGRYWRMSGRPTVCILIREEHLRDVHFRDLLDLLVQFKNGQLKKSGLRIKTGRLQNLINSSCIEHLDFLHLLPHEHLPQFESFRQLVESPKQSLLIMSRSVSFSGAHKSKSQRRHLFTSASSNNLQAIEEIGASSSSTSEDQRSFPDSLAMEDCVYDHQLNFSQFRNKHKLGSPIDMADQNYSTIPCNSIDYYESYKEAPTWPTLIETFRVCTDLSGQSQLLAILWEREGAKYCVDDQSIEDRLEQVSQQACQNRNWSVVRYCSAVLKRSVESLSPWLTSILVNGKQISLGTGPNEKIINNPLTPTEIHTLIYSNLNTKNPCDAVLQQEIALYIGRLISTRPDYFEGILTIRVTNFMSAMRSYLNIKTNERKLNHQRAHQQSQQFLQVSGQPSLLKVDEGSDPASSQQSQSSEDRSPDQERQEQGLGQEQAPEQEHQHQQQLLDLRIKQDPKPLAGGSQQQQQRPAFDLDSQAAAAYVAPMTFDQPFRPQIRVEPPTAPGPSQAAAIVTPSATTLSHKQGRAARKSVLNLVAKPLESLSPSDVRKLLVKVLNDDETMPISDRRQITGELCRVPKDFYDKVWCLLSCTNVGLVIGGKMLQSIPILTSMTQDDLNFALKVESLLSEIDCPKLRQINVELLMALHVILERNPEIRFESDPLDLDKIISLSLEKFRADFGRKDYGLREFYTHSVQTTSLYTVRTVFDCLLPVKYKGRTECRLS